MDITANYCIMILSPVFFWIMKITFSYEIYETLRKKHSKSYIKKHKGNFLQRYFYFNFKSEINKVLYYFHFVLCILCILGIFFGIVYLLFWCVGYNLKYPVISDIVMYFDITLSIVRIGYHIYCKIK